jgi:putative thioredoxin
VHITITIDIIDTADKIKKRKKNEILKMIKGDKLDLKIEVSDNNFEEKVIEQSKRIPILVDFWATWCMPCLMLGPALENLAKQYKGKFVLAKLNVDNSPITSQEYMIQSIPAVKMFKNGKIVDEFIGAIPESTISKWLTKNGIKKE